MEQLTVIGTEDDVIVLATESGERFALAINDVLRAEMRKARLGKDSDTRAVKPSPRDIQAHIRAGLSAQEVAELLNARVEDVIRFEGPVLAEREHVVGQALAVPVLMGGDLEHDALPTFGAAIGAKLAEAGASNERWTSWKEQAGWIVKVEFTAADVDHDARWSFDPRRSTLAPLNADATQLSRQGSLPEGLIPRLRALDQSAPKDESRFDSGAFGPRRLAPFDDHDAATDLLAGDAGAGGGAQNAAIKRAPDVTVTNSETADLLEALRRRRGQREPLPNVDVESERAHSPVALFDALEPGYDDPRPEAPTSEAPKTDTTDVRTDSRTDARTESAGRRKGRNAMPSWDEIVFGARTDEQ